MAFVLEQDLTCEGSLSNVPSKFATASSLNEVQQVEGEEYPLTKSFVHFNILPPK